MTSDTSDEFWECYRTLPEGVRQTARRCYALWAANHTHPGLHFKRLGDTSFYSVRVGAHHRAVGLEDQTDVITWFWIGTHEEYNHLIRNL